jgi:hypothetical protein
MDDPDRLVRTTVYIPANLLEKARVVARQKGVTAAAVIRSALETAVGNHRPPPQGGFLSEEAHGP